MAITKRKHVLTAASRETGKSSPPTMENLLPHFAMLAQPNEVFEAVHALKKKIFATSTTLNGTFVVCGEMDPSDHSLTQCLGETSGLGYREWNPTASSTCKSLQKCFATNTEKVTLTAENIGSSFKKILKLITSFIQLEDSNIRSLNAKEEKVNFQNTSKLAILFFSGMERNLNKRLQFAQQLGCQNLASNCLCQFRMTCHATIDLMCTRQVKLLPYQVKPYWNTAKNYRVLLGALLVAVTNLKPFLNNVI